MTPPLSSIAALIAAIQEAEESFGCVLWARGHSDASWRLVPGAHRKSGILESQVAQMFRLRAPSRHGRCPGWDEHSQWLTLMRHYGLSTRLLDWSESPLIATYFAVSDKPLDQDAAIWLLAPQALNDAFGQRLIPLLSSPDVRPLIHGAFHFQLGDKTVAVQAPEIDARMASQHARYTIHGTREPLDTHPKAASFLRKLTIPKDDLQRIRRELSILGIRRSTVFPDLANLAAELEELRDFDQDNGLLSSL